MVYFSKEVIKMSMPKTPIFYPIDSDKDGKITIKKGSSSDDPETEKEMKELEKYVKSTFENVAFGLDRKQKKQ